VKSTPPSRSRARSTDTTPATPPKAEPAAQNHQTASPGQAGRAWLLFADTAHAQQVQSELTAAGWQVEVQHTQLQHLLLQLHCEPTPPDVLVCGLRFDDGDAFRLMRLLTGDSRAPALFFSTRQSPAVLKSAVAMAAACKLRVAGWLERPAEAGSVAQALRDFPHGAPAHEVAPQPELSAAALRAMLTRYRLQAWLQPLLRLSSREVVGVEALMRGVDEDGSLVMPDRLLPALKLHGLLEEATLAMAHQTSTFLVECLEQGMPLSGAINVSLHSLSDPGFCNELSRMVHRSGLDPSWITLEITEQDAVADLPLVIENTARIRMLGFNLALDDFGTAYSSLLQLSQLPFSELKLDRSFIAGLDTDATKQVVAAACTGLARGLGLRVVAEGVETPAEWRAAQAAGCTDIQGYLLARPMRVDAMRQWLNALEALRLPAGDLPGGQS
jgi:EAL domain-containing protein (putative c-di-GMP-specific phosphodiesterase class I)